SLTGLATLGAVGGHRLEATASGPGADAALAALRQQAADGFGDRDEQAAPTAAPVEAAATAISGLPGSPGSGYGPVRRLRLPEPPEQEPAAGSPDEEVSRLHEAIAAARAEMERARDDASRTVGSDTAGILDAQVLLLSDAAVLDAAVAAARDGAVAEQAWRQAVTQVADAYRDVPDSYQRARADDVDDVARRVLAHLAGMTVTPVLTGSGVLVAEMLGPADTASLDEQMVRAILTARGAPTGHAAILARARGIPAVVGAGDAVLTLHDGQQVLVDGDTGAVHVDPDEAVLHQYERRRADREQADRAARVGANEPAATSDGTRVLVAANVGSVEDAAAAAAAGADGIGLLRTEFLFAGRSEPPTEDEQARTYAEIASLVTGAPVCVRTFDIGADKPAAYLPQAPEDNPFLGVRGLRLGLAHADVLATQLRAIQRAGASYPVHVLLPMVTTVDELDRVHDLIDPGVRVGAMVEVPAAALLADALASRVDFLSIGTNDLVQYALAAERGNAAVAELADPCHPAVLGLIGRVADAATRAGIEVAVCGEMASDIAAVPLLVGLGVGELSVSPTAVPAVKQAVRNTSRAAAEQLAATALTLTTAADVRDLLT
ncbi:MAG: phosphoenolpyruvate--protein phosphotransferase, partial [Streptosporangiales bacterium]